jgi:acetyl-CoA carboxylase biotin carboxyl carrier protein
MNSKETLELAKLLGKIPGIRSIELGDVRSMAELLREFPEVGSVEVRGWFDTAVVLTRTGTPVGGTMAVPNPTSYAAPPALAPAVPAVPGAAPAPSGGAMTPASSALKDIKSPMVGTYYKAPEPGADPYVKVGSRVAVGQTVCIIEAMKIMNEIEAEVAGVIREVLVDDTQPVEFGTVLFRVDPNG